MNILTHSSTLCCLHQLIWVPPTSLQLKKNQSQYFCKVQLHKAVRCTTWKGPYFDHYRVLLETKNKVCLMTKASISLNMERIFGSLPPFTLEQPMWLYSCKSAEALLWQSVQLVMWKSPTRIQTARFRAGAQTNAGDLVMCGFHFPYLEVSWCFGGLFGHKNPLMWHKGS